MLNLESIERLDAPAENLTPENIQRFLRGEITWAEATGLSIEQAYSIADLGYNLFIQGKFDEAKKMFEGLIDLNPKDAYFRGVFGMILSKMDRSIEALESLNLAIELGSNDPLVFVSRGEIYLSNGQFEEALQDLRNAISFDPYGNNQAVQRARAMASATVDAIAAILQKK